ncbi:hypothetical protein [Virgibacillus dakarensis]|nr:hypothetical protein [Virgibacillus dakarensis]
MTSKAKRNLFVVTAGKEIGQSPWRMVRRPITVAHLLPSQN